MSIPNNPDPFDLFSVWYDEAQHHAHLAEPTAMTLATSDGEGQPWPRVVLLKSFDQNGFVFYTNTLSVKGRQIAHNPRVGLCFYWMPLGKQVRVAGLALPVTPAEADEYFASRARGSQIGSWASQQSAPLPNRPQLEGRFAEFEKKYEGREVPRPPHWSGYRVVPHTIEFWLAAPSRLHYRRVYYRAAGGSWTHQMLFP